MKYEIVLSWTPVHCHFYKNQKIFNLNTMIRDNIRIGIKDDLDGGIFKINMIKMIMYQLSSVLYIGHLGSRLNNRLLSESSNWWD